jgi:hypothetical protein
MSFNKDNVEIIVCDNCMRSSCWQGLLMCDDAINAGATTKKLKELKKLNLESPDYWEKDIQEAKEVQP